MHKELFKIFIGIVIIATLSSGNDCMKAMQSMNQHLEFASKFYNKNDTHISDLHLKLALQAAEKARRSCGSRNVEAIEKRMEQIIELQK